MRLGIGSYTYPWAVGVPGAPPPAPLSAHDLLARAAALGVGVVQVADNLPLDRLAPDDLARLAAQAAAQRIAVEVGTRGIAPTHLLTYLRLAERLGSPIVRVVVDTAQHHPDEAAVVAAVRAVMPDYARAGVCLAIENHDRFPAATLVRILEAVDDPHVGICLDTANSLGALEGPAAVLAALGPWTVNLHVKDVVVRRAAHMLGFMVEGRPAGQGQLDIPGLLATLAAQGRDPNAIVELWTPPEPAVAATIATEAAWAAASVAYLRRYIPQ